MTFDVNQTEFSSDRQKEVWRVGCAIVPIDISLADITDSETREGCTQIYNWTSEYLETFYNHPEQFKGSVYRMFRLLDDVAENATIVDNGMTFSMKKYENQISPNECLSDLPLVGLELIDGDGYKILVNRKTPVVLSVFQVAL